MSSLPEAGQVGLQQVVVALVLDVGAEGGETAAGLSGEHAALHLVKQVVEGAAHMVKGKHGIHGKKLLSALGERSVPAPRPLLTLALVYRGIMNSSRRIYV